MTRQPDNSEFDAWFTAQHGEPSRIPIPDLYKQMKDAEYAFKAAQARYDEAQRVADLRYVARSAWDAAQTPAKPKTEKPNDPQ